MRGFDDFSDRGIVGREERHGSEVAEEVPEPEAADGDGHDDVGDGDGESPGEIRFDDPEHIDVAHDHQPDREPYQLANVALEGAREKDHERNREMEQDQDERDGSPSAVQTLQIEGDFSGQVAGPDDEPLREAEVGPDHDEGQHPLAVVVDEVGLEQVRHGLVVEENALDYYGETHGGE